MFSVCKKGKKKTTFNSEITPFHGHAAGATSASEAAASTSKRLRSNNNSSLSAVKQGSDPLTYCKKPFQTNSQRKPDASGKELNEIFSSFLVDIQEDYTQRCDTLTAHIITIAEAKQEVVSEITRLARKVSTFMEEGKDEFITKANFHHSL
jgi:hypothetical protein